MPERTSRPGRSNSFQRMLELERQYMLERLQTGKPQQQLADPSSPKGTSPTRSSIQARRAEFRPTTNPDARREDASPVRRPAPLVINTVAAKPRSETAVERVYETPVMDDVPTAVATPVEKPSPKVVAFAFPPKEMYPPKETDQRSICVSPSWESRDRRKKEKKMMEKKEREERKAREKEEAARNAESKSKKRPARLSKQPPPTSSTDALSKVDRSMPTESTVSGRGRRKERPTSVIGLMSPVKDEATTPRKPRSRSGSFASLIRAPFERRRSSVDHNAGPEFVGGIKLELERHLAQERALNEQAQVECADIHPALRTDKPSHRSWSGPLKSPPPPTRGSGDFKDAQRRAYPPITRHGKAPNARSLISPTAPAIPDLSKIDKWRQRVGLKTPSITDITNVEQEASAETPNQDRDGNTRHKDAPPNHVTKAKADTSIPSSGSENSATTETPSLGAKRQLAKQPSHIAFAQALPPMDSQGQRKESEDSSNNESIPSSIDSRSNPSNGFRTAPSSPPPEPPRRSSKRNSLLSLSGSIPSIPSPTKSTQAPTSSTSGVCTPGGATSETRDRAAAGSEAASTSSITPKASDLSDAKLAFKKASREALRRATSSQPMKLAETKLSGSPGRRVSSKNLRHVPVSSSEDSCSDELHSPSPPSTPATSRPQSEKGLPLLSNGDNALTLPDVSPDHMDDEDEIQAAADRALASFCKAAMGRGGLQRRTNSESTITANQSLLPVPKHQPLRLKHESTPQKTNRASAPASANQAWRSPPVSMEPLPRPTPAPAVYLEEARKLPPAAPATRAPKQRLGPPASFILPDDLPSPSESSDTSRWSDTISRSPRPKSTLKLERDPVAKVFVECCGCKFYHDMPSHLYEAMANPEGVLKSKDMRGYAGAVSITVKCPWCKHEMSTKCCAGLAAMVYVTERLH